MWAMQNYAVYVWSSYAIVFLGLIGLLILSVNQFNRIFKKVKNQHIKK